MSKYYEETKSNYSRDIDHLVTFNKNGLWIKENLNSKQRIISAAKPSGFDLIDVKIFHLDKNSNLIEKIIASKANIKDTSWELNEVIILKPSQGILKKETLSEYKKLTPIYTYEK